MQNNIPVKFGIYFRDKKEIIPTINIKHFDPKLLKLTKPIIYTVLTGLESEGILKFGDLIVKLDKYKINNLYDFFKAKNKLAWNSEVNIQVKRKRKVLNFKLNIKSFDNWKKRYPRVGIHVKTEKNKVIVSEITLMSSALPEFFSPSTLKIGDQLIMVDNKRINTIDDYFKSLDNVIPNKRINFKFIRFGEVFEKNIKIINWNRFIKLNRKFCKQHWPHGISSILVKEYEENDFYLDEKYKQRRLKKYYDEEHIKKIRDIGKKALRKGRFVARTKKGTKKVSIEFKP